MFRAELLIFPVSWTVEFAEKSTAMANKLNYRTADVARLSNLRARGKALVSSSEAHTSNLPRVRRGRLTPPHFAQMEAFTEIETGAKIAPREF